MNSLSLSATLTSPKLNRTKLTKESSQMILKRDQHFPKGYSGQPALYYDHIPMEKSLPQWNQSSSTLRHSSPLHSFSRSERFPINKCNYQDSQTLQMRSTLCQRKSSLGFGQKLKIPEVFSHGISSATRQCPFYNTEDQGIKRSNSAISLKQGKTFGLGWKYYDAARSPHRGTVHSSYQVRSNPGPNKYNVNPQQKMTYNKIKMHQRLQMFTTRNATYRLSEPNPQSYQIKQNLVMRGKRAPSFGFGQKTNFGTLGQYTPGPIYSRKGFCDKFQHLKLKMMES